MDYSSLRQLAGVCVREYMCVCVCVRTLNIMCLFAGLNLNTLKLPDRNSFFDESMEIISSTQLSVTIV